MNIKLINRLRFNKIFSNSRKYPLVLIELSKILRMKFEAKYLLFIETFFRKTSVKIGKNKNFDGSFHKLMISLTYTLLSGDESTSCCGNTRKRKKRIVTTAPFMAIFIFSIATKSNLMINHDSSNRHLMN